MSDPVVACDTHITFTVRAVGEMAGLVEVALEPPPVVNPADVFRVPNVPAKSSTIIEENTSALPLLHANVCAPAFAITPQDICVPEGAVVVCPVSAVQVSAGELVTVCVPVAPRQNTTTVSPTAIEETDGLV